MRLLCFFFSLLCYAPIPQLLPIMLLKKPIILKLCFNQNKVFIGNYTVSLGFYAFYLTEMHQKISAYPIGIQWNLEMWTP